MKLLLPSARAGVVLLQSDDGSFQGSTAWAHPTAEVKGASIGDGSRVWQYVIILPGASIGRDANICSHVFIESDVIIGNNVTIKSGVQLWNGTVIEDDVFVGPNATFSNDKHPKSGNHKFEQLPTYLSRGCSIGAGAVLLPGITVGTNATVGAGSVVCKNVDAGTTVVGNPARPL